MKQMWAQISIYTGYDFLTGKYGTNKLQAGDFCKEPGPEIQVLYR
jgi:hypothetical protein